MYVYEILYDLYSILCPLFFHTANSVKQTFPKNAAYSCHSPNIKLQCTFSVDALTAFWTVLVNGRDPEQVTPSTPGHIVDANELQHGTLYLTVNSTLYSRGNSYSCTAVYPDGDTEFSEVFVTPMVEGKLVYYIMCVCRMGGTVIAILALSLRYFCTNS